jgi:hypothetical protein
MISVNAVQSERLLRCRIFASLDMYPVPRRSHCCAGNMAHLLNHSCEPNAYSRTITVRCAETGTLSDHVVIFAKRSIEAGEELTYDYRCAFCLPSFLYADAWLRPQSRLSLLEPGVHINIAYCGSRAGRSLVHDALGHERCVTRQCARTHCCTAGQKLLTALIHV